MSHCLPIYVTKSSRYYLFTNHFMDGTTSTSSVLCFYEIYSLYSSICVDLHRYGIICLDLSRYCNLGINLINSLWKTNLFQSVKPPRFLVFQ